MSYYVPPRPPRPQPPPQWYMRHDSLTSRSSAATPGLACHSSPMSPLASLHSRPQSRASAEISSSLTTVARKLSITTTVARGGRSATISSFDRTASRCCRFECNGSRYVLVGLIRVASICVVSSSCHVPWGDGLRWARLKIHRQCRGRVPLRWAELRECR
jgi:hypothetical protein